MITHSLNKIIKLNQGNYLAISQLGLGFTLSQRIPVGSLRDRIYYSLGILFKVTGSFK
jgi:hypothetical protein